MLNRLVFLFRCGIVMSKPFNSVKTIAAASLNKINIGRLSPTNIRLVVRMYYNSHGALLLFLGVFFHMFTCAWYLRLSEARYYILQLQEGQTEPFEGSYNYFDMLWLVPITFTTIGYGDYYPRSFYGRAIILWVSFIGILVSAILVALMSNMLTMTRRERKLTKVLSNSLIDTQLRNQAAKVIQIGFRKYKSGKKMIEWPSIRRNNSITEVVKSVGDFQMTVVTSNQPECPCFSRHNFGEFGPCSEHCQAVNEGTPIVGVSGKGSSHVTGNLAGGRDDNSWAIKSTSKNNTPVDFEDRTIEINDTYNIVSNEHDLVENCPLPVSCRKIYHASCHNLDLHKTTQGKRKRSKKGGSIPIIYDSALLLAITDFKKMRMEKLFTPMDNRDMVDMGIMQCDGFDQMRNMQMQIDKLGKSVEKMMGAIEKIAKKLE